MLEIGRVLQKRYRVDEVLGAGGMGWVYRAQHLLLERPVALKALRLDPATPGYEAAVRQFRLEAQMLHDLRHPGLPRIYDFLEEDGVHYLVMDFVPGKTLADVLLLEGDISEARVLEWALQIGEALDYLHSRTPPIIFRDLKPSNVMLREDGRVFLIDFGIAKVLDDLFSPGTRTAARGMLTPGYGAPEQYAGGTDVRSDVYSFGATLYTLLTREHPPSAIDRAAGQALPSVRERRPDVSEKTARAVEAMLSLDRNLRPGDLATCLRLLARGPDDETLRPEPSSQHAVAGPAAATWSGTRTGSEGNRRARTGAENPETQVPTGRAGPEEGAPGHPRRPLPGTLAALETPAAPGRLRSERPRKQSWILAASLVLGLLLVGVLFGALSAPEEPSVQAAASPAASSVRVQAAASPSPARQAAPPPAQVASSSSTPPPRRFAPARVPRNEPTPARAAASPDPKTVPAPPPPTRAAAPDPPPLPSQGIPTAAPRSHAPERAGEGLMIQPGDRVSILPLGTRQRRLEGTQFQEGEIEGKAAMIAPNLGVGAIIEGGRVAAIVLAEFAPGSQAAARYSTVAGTRWGGPASQASREFGRPALARQDPGGATTWIYPGRGISVQVKDGRITRLVIFPATRNNSE